MPSGQVVGNLNGMVTTLRATLSHDSLNYWAGVLGFEPMNAGAREQHIASTLST